MSLNPGSRLSGFLHLAIQFPKLATCLAAVGLTVVAVSAVPADEKDRFVSYAALETYCKMPDKSAFPDFIKQKFNKVCECASGGPVCT